MIPVTKNNYQEVTLNNLPFIRDFKNHREIKDYWKLLQKELSLINEEIVLSNAKKLYKYVNDYPNSTLAKRCCNFPLLEEKCKEYNTQNIGMFS